MKEPRIKNPCTKTKPPRSGRSWVVLLLVAGLLAPLAAGSQTFPSKPVRIISIFGVGSVAESSMRLLGQKLTASLGQPVVVDTQAGAGGVIGGQRVARSAPDGYTLLFTELVQHLVAPLLMKDKPFDPQKDLEPITNALEGGICLIAGTAMSAVGVWWTRRIARSVEMLL